MSLICSFNIDQFDEWEYVLDVVSNFILETQTDQLVAILESENPSVSTHHSIALNFLDFLERDLIVGTLYVHHPDRMQKTFDQAVIDAQEKLYEALKQEVPPRIDLPFLTIKQSCHLRFFSLPRCPELWKPTVSSIRAADINRLLTVSGTVIRRGNMKLIHQKREYKCPKCEHRFLVESDFEQRNEMKMPLECPSASAGLSARPCNATRFEQIEGSETCRDYQEVRIQEQVHRLTVGSIPRSITLVLQDDLVDRCKPGDDVTIVGVLRKRWRPLLKDARPDIELAITAEHVRVHNEERGAERVSRELQEEFASFWRRMEAAPLAGRDFLLRQACPALAGMYLVKLATLLTLLGGVGHTDRTGMKVRGESHMLLVGDAGTGKSQVLRYAARLSPRSVLTTGIGSTAAGLTCTAVKDTSGEWMLEAGALVLADGGLCCVDEFDSIKAEERTAVLEAMEQQVISVAKAGMVCKLRTKCTVFAATNPKGGKMDRTIPLHTQTGLPTPLISRFDIVLLLADSQDAGRDEKLAAHILGGDDGKGGGRGGRSGGGGGVPVYHDDGEPARADGMSQCAASQVAAGEEAWPLEKLRQYLEYVRATFKPTLSDAAQRVLTAYYSRQRGLYDRDSSRTSIRMLEALVRLAQAHARLMFRGVCQVVDAVHAIMLMEGSQNVSSMLELEFSMLKADFPADPEAEYRAREQAILGALNVDEEGHERPPAGGAGGLYSYSYPRAAPPPGAGTGAAHHTHKRPRVEGDGSDAYEGERGDAAATMGAAGPQPLEPHYHQDAPAHHEPQRPWQQGAHVDPAPCAEPRMPLHSLDEPPQRTPGAPPPNFRGFW